LCCSYTIVDWEEGARESLTVGEKDAATDRQTVVMQADKWRTGRQREAG